MKAKELKPLFPIKITITPEHRKEAEKRGGLHKLGLVLLETWVPKELHPDIFWGLSIGNIGEVLIQTDSAYNHNGIIKMLPLYLDKSFEGDEVTFKLR